MTDARNLRSVMPILVGAAVMLSLSMGIRQCFGLFVQPLTKDLALSVSDFTLALSIQNLSWGVLQPIVGALAVRFGFRPIVVAGAALYLAGLALIATAHGMLGLILGAGVSIGASLACVAGSVSLAAAARATPASARSLVFGLITGAGSLGALAAAPLAQIVTGDFGWRWGMFAMFALALVLIPATWLVGRVDKVAEPRASGNAIDDVSFSVAVGSAFARPEFVVMAGAYFVCGMQLLFISTHLPSYLALCGMDPMLSVQALSLIAIFNVFGSVFFGWAGGRWPKLVLLGMIYVMRSLILGLYFFAPPTPETTMIFAASMGFLWLGVAPLTAGAVIEMFGLRWQAMIQGIAFMSHQLGSFAGSFGGGLLFDRSGSYDVAWRLAVALGLTAGIVQIAFAVARPPRLATA